MVTIVKLELICNQKDWLLGARQTDCARFALNQMGVCPDRILAVARVREANLFLVVDFKNSNSKSSESSDRSAVAN